MIFPFFGQLFDPGKVKVLINMMQASWKSSPVPLLAFTHALIRYSSRPYPCTHPSALSPVPTHSYAFPSACHHALPLLVCTLARLSHFLYASYNHRITESPNRLCRTSTPSTPDLLDYWLDLVDYRCCVARSVCIYREGDVIDSALVYRYGIVIVFRP